MPKPIPPPPPQPSLDETHRAVRLLRWLLLTVAVIYMGWSSTYHPDMLLVQYGRSQAQSWMLWKARQLDEPLMRAHNGGRIIWLVGSSVLRDSFDEKVLNTALQERDSPWRVSKFGMNRGASGLTAGFIRALPIQAGDRVIHSVSPDNFRKDWLEKVALPEDRLLMMLEPAELWSIAELPVQKRLELIVSRPLDFHRYHDEYINGYRQIAEALWFLKRPKKARPGYHTRFRRAKEMKWMERALEELDSSAEQFTAEEIDYSPEQFNINGLTQLRQHCAQAEVALDLLDLPHREIYYDALLAPEVREAWSEWSAEQSELKVFPRLPDDHFYDFKHPNGSGRRLLTAHLLAQLVDEDAQATPRGP